jgi:hypothetical protein
MDHPPPVYQDRRQVQPTIIVQKSMSTTYKSNMAHVDWVRLALVSKILAFIFLLLGTIFLAIGLSAGPDSEIVYNGRRIRGLEAQKYMRIFTYIGAGSLGAFGCVVLVTAVIFVYCRCRSRKLSLY